MKPRPEFIDRPGRAGQKSRWTDMRFPSDRTTPALLLGLIVGLCLSVAPLQLAHAESGVSPTRLKLPSAPGSIRGVGEDVETNVNMGMMNYGVTIRTPEGFEGMSPELRLGYSSGAGASSVGLGWSLSLPTIERMTDRGLPSYDGDDRFAVNGSQRLVHVRDTGAQTAIYRMRYEGQFVRYTFHQTGGDGRAGWWKAEYPDGRIGYFGADSDGDVASNARVRGPDGVFRYHLVEMRDPFEHRIRYRYRKDGSTSLINSVGWVFKDGRPRYEVDFSYEDRPDELSNAKPGFDVRLTKRLSSVLVKSSDKRVRRYALAYEPESKSGGLTRLAAVRQYGRTDRDLYPVSFSFEYTGGVPHDGCSGDGCVDPELHKMGTVGVDLSSGKANLIDLNGDSVPDVVDTSGQAHRIHLGKLDAKKTSAGFRAAITSSVADGGAADLSAPAVKMVDLDGDGFTDLIDGANKRVLWNRGKGDWQKAEAMVSPNLPDFQDDANLRFFDWNNDAKIDVIHSDSSTTWYYINRGGGNFDKKQTPGEAIGAGFVADGLQLADVNGDGLQDAVRMARGLVSYRLYLGRGEWSGWVEMKSAPAKLPSQTRFSDINGDGMADLVAVAADRVKYALNRNARGFGPLRTITEAAGQAVPIKSAGTSIRFADMNGNGSRDIVWADASGEMAFMELFPKRPNLLERIENGIGMIMEVDYGSTVQQMAASDKEWKHHLPHPMLTVDQVTTRDTLTGRRHTRRFSYRDGYWDSRMRKFRGFAHVDVSTASTPGVEAGVTSHTFDVGVTDHYRKGKLLEKVIRSGGDVIREITRTWADCDVAEVPRDTYPAVRFICPETKTVLVKEGRPEAEWVEVREEYTFDGYGNRTKHAKLGVVERGGGSCKACDRPASVMGAPCGNTCRGDEAYKETTYIPPGAKTTDGRWILRKPKEKKTYAHPDGRVAVQRTYYDGRAFKGLKAGRLTHGLATRVEKKASEQSFVDSTRRKYDAHGNVVEMRDVDGHARRFAYDDWGLLLAAEIAVLDDREDPYRLRMEMKYHPVFSRPIESTKWIRVEDGQPRSARRPTRYAYDAFGRMKAIAKPGDSLAKPTSTFQFDLGDPASRIVKRTRSKSGGSLDLQEVICFDGRGRKYQTRTLLEPGRYQVDGFVVPTRHKKGKHRQYEPYTDTSSRCDLTPPREVPYVEKRFDALGRPLETTFPDADLHGQASTSKTVYHPLESLNYDRSDTDSESPHFETPRTVRTDGLGRKVAFEQIESPQAEPLVTRVTYDELGHLRGYVDPEGNEKIQHYDLMGRVVRIEDPNSGTTTFEYDDSGNRIARTDARGQTTRYAYDEASRRVAKWKKGAKARTEIRYYHDQLDQCPSEQCTNLAGKLAAVSYPFEVAPDSADPEAIERGWERMGYDARGRQTYFERTLDGVEFGFETIYDNAGHTVALKYPGDRRVDFNVDGAGQVTSVPGHLPEVRRSARGKIDGIAYDNGLSTRYERDQMIRLSKLTTVGRNATRLQHLEYRRDRQGNIVEIDDRSDLPDGVPSADATYSYDALYRLTGAELKTPDANTTEVLSYTYNRINNLIEKTSSLGKVSPAHVGAMTYGDGAGPNAVTEAGGISFEYDDAGRVTAQGSTRYNWDYQGRMTGVERGDETLAQFIYGVDDTRLKKIEDGRTSYYLTDDYRVRDGTSFLYVRLDDRRVVQLRTRDLATALYPDLQAVGGPRADDRITAADAWMQDASREGWVDAAPAHSDEYDSDADPDAILAASAQRMLDDIEPDAAPKRRFLHHNHLGSVTLTTDARGRVVDRTAYYPFGAERSGSGHRYGRPGFTGKERDRSTGFNYFGARHLHARLGRWMSPDPEFEVLQKKRFSGTLEQLDRYGYTANNPINAYDPDGEFLITGTALAVGFAVGAVVSGGAEAARQYYSGEQIDLWQVGKSALVGGAIGLFSGGAGAVGASITRTTAQTVLKTGLRELGKNLLKESVLAVGPEAVRKAAVELGASGETAQRLKDATGTLTSIANARGNGKKLNMLRRFVKSPHGKTRAIAMLRQSEEGLNLAKTFAGEMGVSMDKAWETLGQLKGMLDLSRQAAVSEAEESE